MQPLRNSSEAVRASNSLHSCEERLLWQAERGQAAYVEDWHLLLAIPADAEDGRNGAQIVVVENWFEELRQRAVN